MACTASGGRAIWAQAMNPNQNSAPVLHDASRRAVHQAGKRQGRWTTWFENGKKRSEGGYLDGEMHGPFTLWYESGRKREEGQYVRGRAHGRWIKWDEAGNRLKEVLFKDGVKVAAKDA